MDTPHPRHPTHETLRAYGLGKLDDASAEEVDKHLGHCEECLRQVAELSRDSFLVHLRDAQEEPRTSTADSPAPGVSPTGSTLTNDFLVDSSSSPCMSSTGQIDATTDDRSNANDPRLPSGTRVGYFGDYELERVIGEGGMGVVYKARQLSLNRPVALKMIKAARFASPDEVRRFQNEAEAVARLDHPNIVPIFEVGQFDEQHYFSMKLIAGGSLDKRLKDYVADPRRAATLMATTAEAILHAHQRGILHRDLKPANILVDNEGEPHVSDFGLAKRIDGDSELTRSGAIVGTPAYMAPEQATGSRGAITTSTDVYGLGAILYALLTGRAPFGGPSVLHILEQVRERMPDSLKTLNPRVPRDLEAIVLKCLEKDKTRRYATASDLAADLGRFLRDEPVTARLSSPVELTIQWMRRRPTIAVLGSTVVLVALLGVVGIFWQWRETVRERDVARLNAYFAIMHLAEREWHAEQFNRVTELLESARPKPGEADLRGFEWYYLSRLCHLDSMTLKGHDGPILRVAYSRDGRIITSIGSDGTVKKWDAASGREVLTSKVFLNGDNFPGMSPDGRKIVSAGAAGDVRIFDALSPQTPFAIRERLGPTGSATFSPDGTHIAWSDFGGRVCLWNLDKRQESSPLQGNTPHVSCLVFSPNSRRIASVNRDGLVHVLDTQSGQILLTMNVQSEEPSATRSPNAVWKLAFSPDEKRLAVVGPDGRVKFCDAESGKELLSLKGHSGSVNGLSFSADGRLFASAGDDGTVRVWNPESGRELSVFRGHTGPVKDLAFSSGGYTIASAGQDGSVKLWEYRSQAEPTAFRVLSGARFNRDGSRIGCVKIDGIVNVWDAQSGDLLINQSFGSAETKPGPSAPFGLATKRKIQLSPEFRYAAACDRDKGTIKVCDTRSGQWLFTLKVQIADFALPVFSPDGRRIMAISKDRMVHAWDVESGDEVYTIEGKVSLHQPFSPDGRYLALSADNASINLWDAKSGLKLRTISQSSSSQEFTPLVFSADGQRLVSRRSWRAHSESGNFLGLANEYKVWDARSGRELSTLEGLGGLSTLRKVDSFAPRLMFSPNNRRLFLIGSDGLVKAWDAESGQKLLELKGHVGAVSDLEFSADGRRIVSAGEDRTVRIWDFDSGQELLVLRGHTQPLIQLSMSADGRRLTSIGSDGTVMFWDARDK